MRATLIALPLLLLAHAASAESLSDAVRNGNAAWVAAYNRGDAKAVAALYSDQATVLPPGADLVQGRPAVQAFWHAAIQSGLKNPVLTTISVDGIGRGVAREIGRVSADVPGANGQATKIEGKYVVIWRRAGKTWQLDTDIWNLNK
jgi:uncharacterized protein (TIGR02246 family)